MSHKNLYVSIALAACLAACGSSKKQTHEFGIYRALRAGHVELTADSRPPCELTAVETQATDDGLQFSVLNAAPMGGGTAYNGFRLKLPGYPTIGRPYSVVASSDPGDGEITVRSDLPPGDQVVTGTITFTEAPSAPGNFQTVAADFSWSIDGQPVAGHASGLTYSCQYDEECLR